MAIPFPHPSGDVSRLPRELRDEIYRPLLVSTYVAFKPLPPKLLDFVEVSKTQEPKSEDHTTQSTQQTAGFPILRASQQVNCEAMEILYKESTFQYAVDLYHWGQYSKIPSKEAASRMMNVTFQIYGMTCQKHVPSVDFLESPITEKNASLVCDLIRTFSGSKVLRKTFVLQFGERRHFEHLINKSCQIIHTLKTLKGFETVRVEFRYMKARDLKGSIAPFNPSARRERGQAIYVQRIKELTRRELGTALGPDRSKLASTLDCFPIKPYLELSAPYLEFHPRQHLALLERTSYSSDEDEPLMALEMRLSLMSLQIEHAM